MKKQGFFVEIMSKITKYFLIFIVVVILYLLCSGIRIVDSGNVALVLRFGKLVGDNYEEQVHEPGLMFALPYFIDEVIEIPSGNVMEQSVTTHYTDPDSITGDEGGYLITGDQNIAVVSASVKYIISDPVAYALRTKDIDKTINAVVSTAMLNEAATVAVDDLLTSGKDQYSADVLEFATDKLQKLGLGVSITSLELTQVSMPPEVKEIYDAVNAATVDAETILAEARLYRENVIPKAHSTANTTIADANSYFQSQVSGANSYLSEFYGYLDEYKKSPELVKTRVYSKKFSEAISMISEVRVVQNGESNIIINP